MPSPFPGMDPYLESPDLWSGVHQNLGTQIQNQLAPKLRPNYVARLIPREVADEPDAEELRVMFPDVAIRRIVSTPPLPTNGAVAVAPAPVRATNLMRVPFRQTSIEIRDVRSGLLVTAIELLSPVNKRPGSEGRAAYLRKRDMLLASTVHLLEVDLLRRGERLPLDPAPAPTDYCIVLSRSDDRPDADVWPVSVRAPLPAVPVPLLAPDPDVALDLNAALQTVYDNAAYDLDVDYTVPPFPPLEGEDATWADQRLRAQSLRP